MTENEILKIAEGYMRKRNIGIVLPGEIGERRGNQVEVIFLDTMTLEPDSIVCPPDNRVWVNTETKEVTWIEQM